MALEFRWILFVGLIFASLVFTVAGVALGTLYPVKFIFGILAIAADILAMSTRYFTYLFEPLTKMKNRKLVIDSNDPYIMSPSGNAIMRREGDSVYATVFIKIPIYRSGTEMQDDEKTDFATTFGRMLSIIKEPFRISTQLYVLNKDEYTDKIRTRLNEAQDRYNQMMSKEEQGGEASAKEVDPAAERVRGELTMWRNMLESVNKARAHSMISYAAITAQGNTEDEAVNRAIAKGDELATGISSTFGITATLALGKELLKFIEPDQMIPVANLNEQINIKSSGREA